MHKIVQLLENVLLVPSENSFLILSGIAVLIYRIPVIDKIIRSFHTLLHECGHSVMAILTGSKSYRIELKPDMSGATITENKNKFTQFFIAFSGYPFASAFACLSIFLIMNNLICFFHILLLTLVVFMLLTNIRNTYGIIWGLTVSALLVLQLVKLPQLMWATAVVISSVILIESLIMSYHVLILSFKSPKNAGDAANLKKLTRIHTGFWGLFFFLQAVTFAFLSVLIFFK